jgi:hypothetical protein
VTAPAATPPRPGQHRRKLRRAWLLAALVAGLAAAAATWLLLIRDPGLSEGPLTSPDATSGGFGRTAGEPFAFGLPVAWNAGDQPAVLERVEPVNPTPGLRVLTTRAAGPDRKYLAVPATPEWPSDMLTDLHPVRGFRVDPRSQPDGERGVELVLVLQAGKPGRYQFKAVAVTYTVDGKRHRSYIRNGIGVCITPPGKPTIRGCEPPRGLTGDL